MKKIKASELKEMRKMLGLTQVEMAEKLGYKRRHYQRFESGERPISPRVMAYLSEGMHHYKAKIIFKS